jgi:hypothetical protein
MGIFSIFTRKRTPAAPATPASPQDLRAVHRIIFEFFRQKQGPFTFQTTDETYVRTKVQECVIEIGALQLMENLPKISYPEPLNGLIIDFNRDLQSFQSDLTNKKLSIRIADVFTRFFRLGETISKINQQLKRIE